MALDMGIEVVERVVDRTELYIADEAFFCGTGAQVAWISDIDHRIIGSGTIGPITHKIQKKFFEVVRGEDPRYTSWLTKINID
jgi:branched-chain amino acid aminotransferase